MDKRKQTILIISSLILLLLLNSSCKDEPLRNNNNQDRPKNSEVWVRFDFPDTVYKNERYEGKIEYKSVLDTITTNVLEEIDGKNRYIIYSLIKTKNIDYETKQLRKMALDTFGATNHKTIPLYDIKFTEIGTHYIDGIINDYVIIDTLPEKAKDDDMVRYIENEVRATHKVVVIEKP